jgi:hypothetical protein
MEQARAVPIATLELFDIPGRLISVEELKRGHINRTFVGVWEHKGLRRRYVHQVVNHRIFENIEALMSNLEIVTKALQQHFERSGNLGGESTLKIIATKEGRRYIQDEAGEYWRTFEFIEDTTSYDVCPGSGAAFEAAAILGRFQRALFNVPAASLVDTIPFFLHGGRRFSAFEESLKRDAKKRAIRAAREVQFALQRKELSSVLSSALEAGSIPSRVCHNDMKLNNVLFDNEGRRAVCLLDLDTCMAGTPLFDFGDLVRNTAIPCAEDEQDLSKVVVDMELYEAICQGYMGEMGAELTAQEVKLLPFAPRVLAFVLGTRFLTDYLNGDTYFRTHRPEHNLERARTQFAVVEAMERSESRMSEVLKG